VQREYCIVVEKTANKKTMYFTRVVMKGTLAGLVVVQFPVQLVTPVLPFSSLRWIQNQWENSDVVRLWSQGGHRARGTEVPAWSRGGAPMGSGAKPDIYRQFAATTQVCCRVRPPSLSPKILFGSARIPWPNTAGTGWVHYVPTRCCTTGKILGRSPEASSELPEFS